jgi:hypothetical protein
MTEYVLGLDPGLRGAGVLLYKGNPIHAFELSKCKVSMAKINSDKPLNLLSATLITQALQAMPYKPEIIVLEVPLALPGLGLVAIATAHTNWGILLATVKLAYPDTKVELLLPITWTSAVWKRFCRDPINVKPKDKSRECYGRMWPAGPDGRSKTKATEGSIDAALIAFFWMWKNGLLPKP